MDAALERGWKDGTTPFDGVTFRPASDDPLPLSRFRPLARAILDALKAASTGSALRVLEDWHEHDGFQTTSSAITWSEIQRRISTDGFRTEDDLVSKAIYPSDLSFYFRLRVDDNGEIDVTVPLTRAAAMATVFQAAGCLFTSENSKTFFDRRYGG